MQQIETQLPARTYSAANELNNAVMYVLSGQRSGRRYKVPGTYRRQRDKATGKMANGVYYTASAPGEAPANRTGLFRLSFKRKAYSEPAGNSTVYHAITESAARVPNGQLLGDIMEDGTRSGRIAPRPFKQPTIDRAMPKVRAIYSQRYIR